ncbi:hypothetical protein AVEN_221159-1 [Araneus ventricosus]|uniref:Uncharacterized protein n=1 Tax=Araneus ventricosus TaxID=182803 RepID=A0A4Y2R4A7_ARAVE|nr:hypothetical protein AVEN_221159-1 [Araneus ventricosus]
MSLPNEQFEEKLSPDKCSFNFRKRKLSLGHPETIRRKRFGMLSDGVILPHDNIHISSKTQEFLQQFKWKAWSHPNSPDLAPNMNSKHLYGKRFSSSSDMKTAAENWLNSQGRDFYQVFSTVIPTKDVNSTVQ